MPSKYSIIPIVLEPILNPGDVCKIRIFFTGYGKIEKNKLFINYHPTLVSAENPGKVSSCIGGKQSINECILDKLGAVVGQLDPTYFLPKPDTIREERNYPQIYGECIFDTRYPIEIDLNISKKCPAGDYLLNFVFTYGDEKDVFQDTNDISIHITSRFERHRWLSICLALVGIAVGILALKNLYF
jgi:hypothetical protein